MNCLECQDLLQQRLDGLPIAADPALDRHLSECAACRERHAAARAMLEALRAAPRPVPPVGFTSRVLAAAVRDRLRRRVRLRRSLIVTAALAASILIMLVLAYYKSAPDGDAKVQPGPIAQDPPKPAPPAPEKPHDPAKQEAPPTLAALTGKLADRTLDQAKALLAAANPVEGLPVGEMPNVPTLEPLDPAAQPLRQGAQEAGESFQAVTRSARRALDYFSRELPMFEVSESRP